MKSPETEMTHLTIPKAWLKGTTGVLIAALIGAWSGGVPSFLPPRGSAKAEAAVGRSDSDNRHILESLNRIEALNNDLSTLGASVASLKQTCADLREDVRTLNARVDQFYSHPSSSRWVPDSSGTALVPKP